MITRKIRGLPESLQITRLFDNHEKCFICEQKITDQNFDEQEICYVWERRYMHTKCLEGKGYKFPEVDFHKQIDDSELVRVKGSVV